MTPTPPYSNPRTQRKRSRIFAARMLVIAEIERRMIRALVRERQEMLEWRRSK